MCKSGDGNTFAKLFVPQQIFIFCDGGYAVYLSGFPSWCAATWLVTTSTDACRPVRRPKYFLVSSMTKYGRISETLTLKSACHGLRYRGNHLFCLWFVSSTSTFCYIPVTAPCLFSYRPTKLAQLIGSSQMEMYFISITISFSCLGNF